MKMKYVIIMLILVFTLGCKTENKKKESKESNLNETENISLLDTLQLKLNHNKKWIANPETHIGIRNMDSIILVFKNDQNKDYQTLGKALSEQTSYVIKNCSMTGESHDQLHVVLVPMLDEISVLKESNKKATAINSLIKLETLIQDYFNHFKL